jgi:Helix-turn-helix
MKRVPGFDGQALRKLREDAGLPLAELSRQIQVSVIDLTRYESGARMPGVTRLALLARTFGVKPLDLLQPGAVGKGMRSLRLAAGLTHDEVVRNAAPALNPGRWVKIEHGLLRQLSEKDVAALARALHATPTAVRAAHRWDLEHGPRVSLPTADPPG